LAKWRLAFFKCKVALFLIWVGDLSGFLVQTLQNNVHEEKPIKCFSWRQHDGVDNSDVGETHSKYDILCADKLFGPSWESYVSAYPDSGSRIFKVGSGFIRRDDAREIADLKFVELSERSLRNLDPVQF
jgi:hypothetical protein